MLLYMLLDSTYSANRMLCRFRQQKIYISLWVRLNYFCNYTRCQMSHSSGHQYVVLDVSVDYVTSLRLYN